MGARAAVVLGGVKERDERREYGLDQRYVYSLTYYVRSQIVGVHDNNLFTTDLYLHLVIRIIEALEEG